MRTLLPDPPPAEIEAFLERRRRLGQDRKDEVWEGVLHVVPAPSHRHATLSAQVKALLRAPAHDAGLEVSYEFNLGDSQDDFRVPDGGLHHPGAPDMWHPTAALVLEVISPGDETSEKLSFHRDHHVEEVLIVDPDERAVSWLGLSEGTYRPIDASRLIDLGPRELSRRIGWP